MTVTKVGYGSTGDNGATGNWHGSGENMVNFLDAVAMSGNIYNVVVC